VTVAKDARKEAEEEGGEFADFLADVSKEIAQRVESLDKRATPAAQEKREKQEKKKTPIMADAGVIVEWPTIADRLIEEMR
jgi:F0F1-type ATP synthase membrane subunit b/b'